MSKDFYAHYSHLRQQFVQGAAASGWALTQRTHPLSGQDGMPDARHFGVDIARFGPDLGEGTARKLLFVLAGVHGTELEAGSIAQLDLMQSLPALCPSDCAIVLIHGVNPYGCAYLSRTDENNVDPNRNLRSDWTRLPANVAYDGLHSALCPAEWQGDVRAKAEQQLKDFVVEQGLRALTQNVLRGQYEHPDGLFYGGAAESWTLSTLRAVLAQHSAGAEQIAILDIHTGVGPKGWGELIRLDRPAVEGAEWSDIGGCVCELADTVEATTPAIKIILEFGTRPFDQVLTGLRGDNWLRHHARDASQERAAEIKADLYRALICQSPEWRAGVVSQTRAAAAVVLRELQGVRSDVDVAVDAFGRDLSAASEVGQGIAAVETLALALLGPCQMTLVEGAEQDGEPTVAASVVRLPVTLDGRDAAEFRFQMATPQEAPAAEGLSEALQILIEPARAALRWEHAKRAIEAHAV